MMKLGILAICILTTAAVSAFAQTRTITNFELERYRTQRVQAEKDLNENYKELGFSSPEERAKRLDAWKKESQELSDRLEQERAARENAEALAEQAASQQQYYPPVQSVYGRQDGNTVYWYENGFDPFNNRIRPRVTTQLPPGYFAGGAFWPSSPSTRPRPILAIPRTDPPRRPRR
jgi:hypothetical protein